VVVSGHSSVDQSLAGEPVPEEKTAGDSVICGSINRLGTLLIKVTAVGEESFLQQVVRHVEDARALKPGVLHLVDQILLVYAPVVLVLSALSFVGWTAGSWLLTGEADLARGVFAGLSVLVMGYPCAVGIAAPLSIVRGAGEAADQGIIMRTGEAFQTFRLVRQIVTDKTGTLTIGRPVVQEIAALRDEDELLALAAAAEASSEHPLGQAVLSAALDRRLAVPNVEDFEAVSGRGVAALIGGSRVRVGRPAYLQEHGVDLGPLEAHIAELEEAGNTVVAVSRDLELLGAIALGDELRDDAIETVAAFKRAHLAPVLVTGDNPRAARHVAEQVGIDQVYAGVLPGRKAEIVRELQQRGRVAMVGDGINDAPALMQADVGIAMGSGTDIAIESADVIIVSDRLHLRVDVGRPVRTEPHWTGRGRPLGPVSHPSPCTLHLPTLWPRLHGSVRLSVLWLPLARRRHPDGRTVVLAPPTLWHERDGAARRARLRCIQPHRAALWFKRSGHNWRLKLVSTADRSVAPGTPTRCSSFAARTWQTYRRRSPGRSPGRCETPTHGTADGAARCAQRTNRRTSSADSINRGRSPADPPGC
jgi:heavy metal translocating P-type ATPase